MTFNIPIILFAYARPDYLLWPMKMYCLLANKSLHTRFRRVKMVLRPTIGPFILMYHSIVNSSEDPYAVSVDAFEEQMSWLSDNGFQVVPLAFLFQSLRNGDNSSLNKKVVLTFDDGCQDFNANALPALLRYRMTATVFLVTGMMGKSASWSTFSKHVRLMTEDEVRYIKTQGISLGSHTVAHVDLTSLDPAELKRQLENSRDKLADLSESFLALSYPWGNYSAGISDAVKASSYECAVVAGGGRVSEGADAYRLPRIVMRGDMDFMSFRAIFSRPSISNLVRRYGRALKRRLTTKLEQTGIT
jgi:peptidoglycan/xylan/chitin deacetylase (PgdA/CDA1 family)